MRIYNKKYSYECNYTYSESTNSVTWVWVDDVLLQDDLVSKGYAEVAYLYGKYKYVDLLKDHQAVAEASKIGVWNEEARKEFDANSNNDKKSNKKDKEFSIDDMSTKEIIVFIIIVVLLSIITPIVNEYKKKLKKMLK